MSLNTPPDHQNAIAPERPRSYSPIPVIHEHSRQLLGEIMWDLQCLLANISENPDDDTPLLLLADRIAESPHAEGLLALAKDCPGLFRTNLFRIAEMQRLFGAHYSISELWHLFCKFPLSPKTLYACAEQHYLLFPDYPRATRPEAFQGCVAIPDFADELQDTPSVLNMFDGDQECGPRWHVLEPWPQRASETAPTAEDPSRASPHVLPTLRTLVTAGMLARLHGSHAPVPFPLATRARGQALITTPVFHQTAYGRTIIRRRRCRMIPYVFSPIVQARDGSLRQEPMVFINFAPVGCREQLRIMRERLPDFTPQDS